MFHYITVLLAVIISTNVKGDVDVNDEFGQKYMLKRHDGYVMDIGYFVKFLADVQTERREQKKQVDAIEKLVKDSTREMNKRYRDLSRRSANQFTKIQKQINNIKTTADTVKRKYMGLENQVVLMQNQTATQINVAFYAWLSKGDTSTSDIIKYDQVTTNIGNGYNAKTGHFVAPVSGIYMIAVTLMDHYSAGPAHLDIVKNGKRVGAVRSEISKDLDSGTKVIVLNLMASDVVYLKNYINHGLHTDTDYAFNTFSGFLIKQHI